MMRKTRLLIPLLLLLSAGSIFAQHEAPENPAAAEHESAPAASMTLWKWANFAILAGLIGYYLSKNAGAFFAGRTAEIQRGIAEATALRQEAEARVAEIEQRFAGLEAEVESLRRAAREEFAAEGQRIQAETAQLLEKIHLHAQQDIAAAVKAARQELRAESVALAAELAEQKIKARMTPEVQQDLVKSFIGELQPSRLSQEVH